MGFFSNAFNPNKKYLNAASRALERARFQGGLMTGAGGLSAGFSFDDKGKISTSTSLGQFQPLFQQMLGASQGFMDKAMYGDQALEAAFDPNMQAFQQMFNANAQLASQDPLERGQQVTELMRQRAAPGAQNLVNSTFDRLFSSGGLSNQVTREQTTESMRRSLADEDAGFQLAGMQFGEQSVQNAFGRSMGAHGAMRDMAGFLEAVKNTNFGQAMASSAGAQGLSMMPMQLMGVLAGLQGQRSNTELAIAGGYNQSASLAQSAFQNFSNWLNNTATSAANNYLTYQQAANPEKFNT